MRWRKKRQFVSPRFSKACVSVAKTGPDRLEIVLRRKRHAGDLLDRAIMGGL